jgi:hypothetical protein
LLQHTQEYELSAAENTLRAQNRKKKKSHTQISLIVTQFIRFQSRGTQEEWRQKAAW